jgi:hypothetical protein
MTFKKLKKSIFRALLFNIEKLATKKQNQRTTVPQESQKLIFGSQSSHRIKKVIEKYTHRLKTHRHIFSYLSMDIENSYIE